MYDLPQNSQKNSKKSDFQNSNAFEIADKNESFALDEIPQGLSPVSKALEYQKAAATLGFEWKNLSDIREKVLEELNEVCEAYDEFVKKNQDASDSSRAQNDKNAAFLHVEEEIGDLLFAVVDYARKLSVDAESALFKANEKFYRRFSFVQKRMTENLIPQNFQNIDMMEKFWNEAKSKGL